MLKTLKRKIALVAVAALGSAGLAVVAAPAANAVSTVTAISASTAYLRTGVGGQITIDVTGAETNAAAITRARVLQAPVGVAANCAVATVFNSGAIGGTGIADGDQMTVSLPADCDKDGNYQFLVWIDPNAAGGAGAEDGGNTAPASANVKTTVVNITTSGAPTSIALNKTAYTGANTVDILGAVTIKDANSRLTKLAVGDFLTLSITAGSLGTVNGDFHATTATTNLTTAGSVASADSTTTPAADGTYPIAVKGANAGSGTLTVAAAGTIASLTGATATLTLASPTYANLTKVTNTKSLANSNNGTTVGTLASAATPDGAFAAAGFTDGTDNVTQDTVWVLASTAAPAVTFRVNSAAASKTLTGIRVVKRAAVDLPAGVTADTADRVVTTAATASSTAFTGTATAYTADITITSTAPIAGSGYDFLVRTTADGDGILYKVVYVSPNVGSTSVGTLTLAPTNAEAAKATIGGSATVKATVKDQFGDVFAGANVIVTITGRNAQVKNIQTGTDGVATFTYTDTSTSTTTFQDVFAVKAAAPTNSVWLTDVATQINWSTAAALAVDTVTVASDSATNRKIATSSTPTGVFTSTANGVIVGNTVGFTATVKNALGAGITGVPVVFTVVSGGAVATTGSLTATIYSGVGGATTAFSIIATGGPIVVKAAAGGKEGASNATVSLTGVTNGAGTIDADGNAGGGDDNIFTAIAAGGNYTHSRVLAMKDATASVASGSAVRLSATVKDRYGNLVPNQNVIFTITGTVGRFGGGALSVTSPTDASGVAIADFVSLAGEAGSATVTATMTAAAVDNSTATTTAVGGAYPAAVTSATTAVTITAAAAAANPALDAVKGDVKAVSDTVATLSKAVTTVQSSVTELTSTFATQIKSLTDAIAKISRAIAAIQKSLKKK